jgi:hypothetical protein
MDFIVEYEQAKKIVDDDGWDSFLDEFKDTFDDLDIYAVSKDWYKDKSFILKAKGGKGDVVIGWEGIDYD